MSQEDNGRTLAELDAAIRAGDDLERIHEWPGARHFLRQKFGDGRSDAELWRRFADYMQYCRERPDWYLGFPIYALPNVLKMAAVKEGSVEIPIEIGDDGVGRAPEWAIQGYGLLLDEIILGPAPGCGNTFPISSFDAIVVDGNSPSVCPKADRELPEEFLPDVLEVFKRHGYVKPG